MKIDDDGGAAFPMPARIAYTLQYPPDEDGKVETDFTLREEEHGAAEYGMTLRDWFAGQALVGLLAFSPVNAKGQMSIAKAAQEAWEQADAMIAERSKRHDPS